MDVPIFRLHYSPEYKKQYQELCERIFDRAFLTNDLVVEEFEREFAKWSGAKHSIAVNNGTSALEVLLRALDVRGFEVILPANTFIASAVAVVNAGGIPVAADIEPHHASLDPACVEKLISQKTKAVMTVHIGGLISPGIYDLRALCEKHGLKLIEDCAHAHGCKLDGIPVGTFTDGGAFSFFTTKVLTTGEGGAVICNDTQLLREMKSIRQFGKSEDLAISHVRDGGNFKWTEFQAALGLIELKYAKEKIQQRQEIAALYQKGLAGSTFMPLVPAPGSECTYYKQIIWPQDKSFHREKLAAFLEKRGIALTGGVYNIPLHRQPYFKGRFADRRFPVTDAFAEQHFCPPCYPGLSEEEVTRTIRVLLEFAG